MLPNSTGEVKESPRQSLTYFSDDGELMAVRVGDWKPHFAVQRAFQMNVWAGARPLEARGQRLRPTARCATF